MAEVRFDEEPSAARSYGPSVPAGNTGISKWLVAKGLAKNENAANKLMIGVIIGSALVAIVVFILSPRQHSLTDQERARIQATTPRAPR